FMIKNLDERWYGTDICNIPQGNCRWPLQIWIIERTDQWVYGTVISYATQRFCCCGTYSVFGIVEEHRYESIDCRSIHPFADSCDRVLSDTGKSRFQFLPIRILTVRNHIKAIMVSKSIATRHCRPVKNCLSSFFISLPSIFREHRRTWCDFHCSGQRRRA